MGCLTVWDLDSALVTKHDESTDNTRTSTESNVEFAKFDDVGYENSITYYFSVHLNHSY
jgi:hypothetical protein